MTRQAHYVLTNEFLRTEKDAEFTVVEDFCEEIQALLPKSILAVVVYEDETLIDVLIDLISLNK